MVYDKIIHNAERVRVWINPYEFTSNGFCIQNTHL